MALPAEDAIAAGDADAMRRPAFAIITATIDRDPDLVADLVCALDPDDVGLVLLAAASIASDLVDAITKLTPMDASPQELWQEVLVAWANDG